MINVRVNFTHLVCNLIGVCTVQGNELESKNLNFMHLGRMSTKFGAQFR